MTEGACDKPLTFACEYLAVPVKCGHGHIHRACHLTVLSGKRQTALRSGLLTRAFSDYRVDQFNNLSAIINNCNTFQNAHLRRGESRAVRVSESLPHIVKKLKHPRRYLFNGAAFFAENFVSLGSYIKQCHGCSSK